MASNTSSSDTTASSSASTPLRSHGKQRRAPEETVHMSVLGRDGTDIDLEVDRRYNEDRSVASGEAVRATSPSSPRQENAKSNWWGRVLLGKTASTDDHQDHPITAEEAGSTTPYTSLEPPLQPDVQRPNRDNQRNGSPRSILSATHTIEDKLKQDCSFFYQGMDDALQRGGAHGSNAGLGPRTLASTLHQAVPRLLSSRDGARFHAKYEQLNQDIAYMNHHELAFDDSSEYSVPTAAADARPIFPVGCTIAAGTSGNSTQKLSSLIFEQNGRLLMKLPRDQIRLVMDDDLEPGIISVEQWRKADSHVAWSDQYSYDGMIVLEDTTATNQDATKKGIPQPPPLRYVMTVPDDLYKRVVAEMSYALLPPCWGFFRCCNDPDGRADISLALAILFVILLLMFISTLEWPTE